MTTTTTTTTSATLKPNQNQRLDCIWRSERDTKNKKNFFFKRIKNNSRSRGLNRWPLHLKPEPRSGPTETFRLKLRRRRFRRKKSMKRRKEEFLTRILNSEDVSVLVNYINPVLKPSFKERSKLWRGHSTMDRALAWHTGGRDTTKVYGAPILSGTPLCALSLFHNACHHLLQYLSRGR